MIGKVYGVGVGPGDAELLTLKAVRILNEADIIYCPEKREGAGSFAYEIAEKYIKNGAEIRTMTFPMNYSENELGRMHQSNAKEIAFEAKNGKIAAFITLGDPSVYSTYMYMVPYLKEEGVEIETIPGVTSFCSSAARVNMPIVEWNEGFAVVPMRNDGYKKIDAVLDIFDNVVVMKPSADGNELKKILRDRKLEENFVMVTKCGTNTEEINYNLENMNNIPYLSTIIIKKNGINTKKMEIKK